MTEEIRHYCGLFGIAPHEGAAELAYLGLIALQHRGQEAAGIATSDGTTVKRNGGMGLVRDAFSERDILALKNPVAIGHVRYSTTGSCSDANIQPLFVRRSDGDLAICHNGNLVNATNLRHEYEQRGSIFSSTSDTEVILHMLADPHFAAQPDPLAAVLRHVTGSFCLLLLYADRIEAVRDPSGNRPLAIGKLDGAWIVTSETCSLDIVGAKYVRDVEPGEIVTISHLGSLTSRRYVEAGAQRQAQCIFEHVYFADPSSSVFGENVHQVRKDMGKELAREAPVEADVVIDVPNSGRCAALGFSEQSGIPIGRGFTTNHYVGRSFIQPTQLVRNMTVRLKLNPIRPTINGKRIVVVEDSVVRGTTTRGKIRALRDAGAKAIHFRVASSPIRHPCFYGIDFPRKEELVANGRTVEQIRQFLEVDSLHYLSVEGMLRAIRTGRSNYCTACFNGDYPIPIDPAFQKDVFEHKQMRFFDSQGLLNVVKKQ